MKLLTRYYFYDNIILVTNNNFLGVKAVTQLELNTTLGRLFEEALEEFIREMVGDQFNQSMMDSFPNKDELITKCLATCKEAGVLAFTVEQFFNEARSDEFRSTFKGLLKRWAKECVEKN